MGGKMMAVYFRQDRMLARAGSFFSRLCRLLSNAFGRFSSVSSSVSSVVSYSRLPGTDLISGYTAGPLTISKSFEPHRDLITSVSNHVNHVNLVLISAYDYANDAIGRRTNTYVANALNQYTAITNSVSLRSPTYDADGNMLSTGDGWHYVWNGENRLILASNAQHTVTYSYDHMGRMVSKIVDDSFRTFLWDGYNIVREAISNPQSQIPMSGALIFPAHFKARAVSADSCPSIKATPFLSRYTTPTATSPSTSPPTVPSPPTVSIRRLAK
jgi:YD repeat-containing protein